MHILLVEELFGDDGWDVCRLATATEGLYAQWVRNGDFNLAGPYASGSYLCAFT